MRLKSSQSVTYAVLLAGTTAIAFSAMFVRWANVGGVVAALYRQAFALVVLTPLLAFHLRSTRRENTLPVRTLLFAATLAGLLFAGDIGVWSISLSYTSAASATLLANTAPLYVGLGSILFFGEKLGTGFWLGLAIALAGAALVVGVDLHQANQAAFGSLLALIAGVSYGLYLLLISQLRLRGMDPFWAAWLTSAGSGLVLLVAAITFGQTLSGFALRQWIPLAASGIISQAIGYVAIAYALGRLPAPRVSATLLGQPILTAILAIPLLGEALSLMQILGGLVTLVGIFLVNRSKQAPTTNLESPTT